MTCRLLIVRLIQGVHTGNCLILVLKHDEHLSTTDINYCQEQRVGANFPDDIGSIDAEIRSEQVNISTLHQFSLQSIHNDAKLSGLPRGHRKRWPPKCLSSINYPNNFVPYAPSGQSFSYPEDSFDKCHTVMTRPDDEKNLLTYRLCRYAYQKLNKMNTRNCALGYRIVFESKSWRINYALQIFVPIGQQTVTESMLTSSCRNSGIKSKQKGGWPVPARWIIDADNDIKMSRGSKLIAKTMRGPVKEWDMYNLSQMFLHNTRQSVSLKLDWRVNLGSWASGPHQHSTYWVKQAAVGSRRVGLLSFRVQK